MSTHTYARSLSSEDGSESTENSPAVTAAETDGDGEAQETFSYTLLSNSGTIKIISDENFDAFGMYAKASNNGTVFAENYGLIDLSEAKVESPYSYRAQLLAEYSSGGSVVLGDWTMAVSELQLGYVPFVVSGSGEGGLTVNPGSTLYLVFDRAEQIGQQVTVTQLFGAYDEEKNAASESTALPTADGSTFSRLLAGTDMIVLDGGITGNSAAFTATVDPSRSVGEEARYMALTSALNRYLTLRGLTQDRVRMSEDGFSLMAIPWYTHDNVDGANGYQTRGYSLALKGAWKSGAIDASAYFAGGHESLEGHRHQTEGSSDTYSIGAAARYWLTDSFYAGARFDYGYADTDWTVSDRLGSDSADASAQTAYLGLSAGVLQRFGAQSIGAELAAGWLHLKQDALSVAPIGTGRTSHASESIDTALITAETYWQGVFDVDGYAVKPQLTLSAAYLTNTDFGEGFEYLSRRYVNAYELEDFYGSASAGIGFEKGNGCLEAKLGYRAASDFSSYTADLRFTWKF